METPGHPHTVRTRTHLAYQPLLPTTNKYLQQTWDKATYNLHRTMVKSAKPTIDATPPKTYAHLTLNLKKLQIDEERTMKIQMENKRNQERIKHIMRTTGQVDNRNYYERKSLGMEKRQQELLQIAKENKMIQSRLSHCRSHYDAKTFHEDWLKTLQGMNRIAHYPRTTANQQKGQRNPSSSKRAVTVTKNKRSTLHTHNKANDKAESEENVKREDTSKTEGTGREIQQDIAPEPNVPEKSISPGTPENPGSSDTYNR